MSNTRTYNSIKNSGFAMAEQAIYSIFQFIVRTVFISTLGKTYLGFSGLFNDILTLMSLAELGVGTAITYSMYKPVAENDSKKVVALLNLYRYIYTGLGIIMTLAGLLLIPFLNFFISGIPDIPELPYIFLLYLLNTTCSYFFIYKKSILITHQVNYVSSIIWIICTLLKSCLQIVFLLYTKDFIIFLWIQLIFTLLNNILISIYVDKKYSDLKKYKKEQVDTLTKKQIMSNIGAMFISKLSSAVVTSTDNILISKFVSTVILGVYSNYTLFTTMFRTIITKLFEGITGSVGNLIATSKHDKIYDTFKNIWFVNFWLVGFSCAGLYVLVNPFIKLWIGNDYLLSKAVVSMICINLYMRLIRNTFITLTDTCGLFKEFRIKSIAEAIINLVVSLVLLINFKLGIFGVFSGTLISNLCTNFWFEPYIIYKKVFCEQYWKYFLLYWKYFIVTVVSAVVSDFFISRVLTTCGWLGFGIQLVACVAIINGFFLFIFHRSKEFNYFFSLLRKKIKKNNNNNTN